ncbi:MAG: hypothetical protein EKK31_30415 [Hyphomicrobiales bacterium]|nr:MAG: hypothetical protein EKK31_30415 [Hyphomicrobiales bacterium]
MPNIGEYSSVIQIGFGLNLAVSYVNLFVNPALSRAERDVARFSWWIETPERLKEVVGKKLALAEFEEALSHWLQKTDRMTHAIEMHRRGPIFCALSAALALYVSMLFPSVQLNIWSIGAIVFLSFAPVVLGSGYLWFRTREERAAEREACRKANKLFMPKR